MDKETFIFMTNGLSMREAQIAVVVCTGLKNKEVGDKLFICEKTVRYHLTNIYKKIPPRNKTEMILWLHKKKAELDNGL